VGSSANASAFVRWVESINNLKQIGRLASVGCFGDIFILPLSSHTLINLIVQPTSLAHHSVVLRGAASGKLGQHLFDFTLPQLSWAIKLLVTANILFNVSISCSRLSALALYARVYTLRDPNDMVWRWSWVIVTALCIAWPLAMIPMNLFECDPVRKLWMPWLPGRCMTQFEIFMISGATSVFVDLLVLILPLPKIFKLHMDSRKKFIVGFGFLAGYR
jgi:hypothetical protein